jgi:uncharacterized protein (TIGR03083 family)
MSEPLDVLRERTTRLADLAVALNATAARAPAYPSEWSIAEVFSHLGSSAEITSRRMDAALGGEPMPEDFPSGAWGVWNSKAPDVQVADGAEENQLLQLRIDALTDDERARFDYRLGPITTDFAGFVNLRLSEMVLHLWDIEVALDRRALLAPEAVPLVVDQLGMVAAWTAKSGGRSGEISVRTTEPDRGFRIGLRPDRVSFDAVVPAASPDLQLPAEAFIRLVYGRLDPEHAPTVHGSESALDELRSIFPGP